MSESFTEPNMSVEEYLEQEERSTVRQEYVQGGIFAMSGATQAHNLICGHLYGSLYAHLNGSPCRACMNDMKVRIEAANCFYYPDVMVTCEPLEPRSVYITKPVLIIEVLSPSTAQIDRREKLVAYKKIHSLQEYVIVHQSKPLIELHRKQSNGKWMVTLLRQSDQLHLESVPNKPFSLPVTAIYEGLDFSEIVEESLEEYSIG